MCELIHCNLHNKRLNTLMAYLLAVTGSGKQRDGVGFICDNNSYWKSKLSADSINNLGTIIRTNIKDDSPISAHIRNATFGIPIEDKNAHPFMGDNFLLMHNGTLLRKEDDEAKKEKDSDSEDFLNQLELEHKISKNKTDFVTIFNNAMEHFTGKFALIIRDRRNTLTYIVRGKTAELYISNIETTNKEKNRTKEVGYIIDTSKITMDNAFFAFRNVSTTLSNLP